MSERIICNRCAKEHDYSKECIYDWDLHIVLNADDWRNELVFELLDNCAKTLQNIDVANVIYEGDKPSKTQGSLQ